MYNVVHVGLFACRQKAMQVTVTHVTGALQLPRSESCTVSVNFRSLFENAIDDPEIEGFLGCKAAISESGGALPQL